MSSPGPSAARPYRRPDLRLHRAAAERARVEERSRPVHAGWVVAEPPGSLQPRSHARGGPPGLAEADQPVASRAGASRAHEPVASRARAPVAERARGRTLALVPSQAPLPAERSRRGLERPYPRRGRAAAYPRAMSRTPHADACWEPAREPRGPHRGLSVPVPSTQPTPESAIAGAERPRRGRAARAVVVRPRQSLRLAASCQGFATAEPYPRRSAPWHVGPRARSGRWASRMARVGSLHGPVHEPHGSV